MQSIRPIALLLLASIALAPTPIRAQELTSPRSHLGGHEILSYCKGKFDVDYGVCAGYVQAIADIMVEQPLYGLSACGHGGIKAQQLMDSITPYLAQDADAAKSPADLTIARALAQAFPCR